MGLGYFVGRYIVNILVAIDQLANAILFGDPDETISSRLGKMKLGGRLNFWGRLIDWFLSKLDPNHTIKSIEEDEGDEALIK